MKDIRLNMRLHFTFRKFSTHDFDKPWVLTANNQLNSGCIAYKLCTLCFILPFNDKYIKALHAILLKPFFFYIFDSIPYFCLENLTF